MIYCSSPAFLFSFSSILFLGHSWRWLGVILLWTQATMCCTSDRTQNGQVWDRHIPACCTASPILFYVGLAFVIVDFILFCLRSLSILICQNLKFSMSWNKIIFLPNVYDQKYLLCTLFAEFAHSSHICVDFFSWFSSFLPNSKDVHVRLIDVSQLPRMSAWVWGTDRADVWWIKHLPYLWPTWVKSLMISVGPKTRKKKNKWKKQMVSGDNE